jgi:endonuclease YncB( thermonuclease family)
MHWRLGLVTLLVAGSLETGHAACSLPGQGSGRVNAVIDGRTFRFDDGREVRLAGIELVLQPDRSAKPLAALIDGRDVELNGRDDAPDRYGRQSLFAFTENSGTTVQAQLLSQGDALFSGLVADRPCAAELAEAEAEARNAHRGVWAEGSAIKNAENPDDILARVGQFTVVEGKALSVRQSGTVFYVNFGRRWTEGFAVTISKRMIAPLEAAGLAPKSLENRRLRIRGWVERRGGPRIDIFQTGQIELVEG